MPSPGPKVAGTSRALAWIAPAALSVSLVGVSVQGLVPVTGLELRTWWHIVDLTGWWIAHPGWVVRAAIVPVFIATLVSVAASARRLGKHHAGYTAVTLTSAALLPLAVLEPAPTDLGILLVAVGLAELATLQTLPKRRLSTAGACWLRFAAALLAGASLLPSSVGVLIAPLAFVRREALRGTSPGMRIVLGAAVLGAIVIAATRASSGEPDPFGAVVVVLIAIPMTLMAWLCRSRRSAQPGWLWSSVGAGAALAIFMVLLGGSARMAGLTVIPALALLSALALAGRREVTWVEIASLGYAPIVALGLVGLMAVYGAYGPGLPAVADPSADHRARPQICERALAVMEDGTAEHLMAEDLTLAAQCAFEGGFDPAFVHVLNGENGAFPPGSYVMVVADPVGAVPWHRIFDTYRLVEEAEVATHLDRSHVYRVLEGKLE